LERVKSYDSLGSRGAAGRAVHKDQKRLQAEVTTLQAALHEREAEVTTLQAALHERELRWRRYGMRTFG